MTAQEQMKLHMEAVREVYLSADIIFSLVYKMYIVRKRNLSPFATIIGKGKSIEAAWEDAFNNLKNKTQ